MRFCSSGFAFVLLSGLAIASAGLPYVNEWTESADGKTFTVAPGDASTCTATTDMFPSKIMSVDAQFSVEYKNHYKIVTNKVEGAKYLLVQRGCTAPTDAEITAASLASVSSMADITATFTVPLTSVALTSSSYFPVFHYMGEKQAIRLYSSSVMYSSNGCMQKQAANGHTLLNGASYDSLYEGGKYVDHTAYKAEPAAHSACTNCTCTGTTMSNSSEYHNCTAATSTPCTCERTSSPHPTLDALNIQATFGGVSGKNLIKISDTTEESFYHVGEWSEYIATFFNKELEVKGLADTARTRWNGEKNGIITQLGSTRRKVLLLGGYHIGKSYYYDGWMVPPCKKADVCPEAGSAAGTKCGAERWCQLVRDAGGEVMNMNLPATWTDSQYGGGAKEGVTNAQLIAFAAEVDVVIFKSAMETEVAMTAILADMKGIKAVDDSMAFDNQRIIYSAGVSWDGAAKIGNAIFENAQIEPDVMLQDIIKMVDPAYNHKMVFFRNLKTEGMGNDIPCPNKAGKAGCVMTPASLIANCTNQTSTDDVLLYIPDGFMAALSNDAGRVAVSVVSMLALFAVSLGLMH